MEEFVNGFDCVDEFVNGFDCVDEFVNGCDCVEEFENGFDCVDEIVNGFDCVDEFANTPGYRHTRVEGIRRLHKHQEHCFLISLYMTDYGICKALCGEKFYQIERNGLTFSHIYQLYFLTVQNILEICKFGPNGILPSISWCSS